MLTLDSLALSAQGPALYHLDPGSVGLWVCGGIWDLFLSTMMPQQESILRACVVSYLMEEVEAGIWAGDIFTLKHSSVA